MEFFGQNSYLYLFFNQNLKFDHLLNLTFFSDYQEYKKIITDFIKSHLSSYMYKSHTITMIMKGMELLIIMQKS